MPISLDEENALEKVARNTYEDHWLADGIAHLRAKLASRDALIDDHLRKIMHLENRIEEEAHRADQLEADLKHVQGSDVGMMKLLHAEKLKTEAAERRIATLLEALMNAQEALMTFYGRQDAIIAIDSVLVKMEKKDGD